MSPRPATTGQAQALHAAFPPGLGGQRQGARPPADPELKGIDTNDAASGGDSPAPRKFGPYVLCPLYL